MDAREDSLERVVDGVVVLAVFQLHTDAFEELLVVDLFFVFLCAVGGSCGL